MIKLYVRKFMDTKVDDYVIQFLIVMSLVLLVVETEPWLTRQQLYWLHFVDKTIVIIFTIEYLIRAWLDGKKFTLSFHGIIDLLAIAPYYLSLGVGYQSIRVFRLFRLLRLLKLARYTSALDRIVLAIKSIKAELMIFSIINICFIYLAAVLVYHAEHAAGSSMFSSMFDALWWATVTFTTIGYGDIYPITPIGKMITAVLSMMGLGIVAIPTGLISAALTTINGNK
jgi:voltage-gated potassium channel